MKLINVDTAKKAVHEEFDECLVWDESGEYTANVTEEILEALPTVDAVPVIRCKECKYAYRGYKKYVCTRQFHDFSIWPDGYCSLAERKEECGHR